MFQMWPNQAHAASGDSTASTAAVDPSGAEGGGGVSEPGTIPDGATPGSIAQAADKTELAAEYYRVKFRGKSDTSRLNALTKNYRAKYGADALPNSNPMATLARTTSGTTRIAASAFVSYSLPLYQVPQEKGYYCGPGSGYAILEYLLRNPYTGPKPSAYNGAALSQSALATTAHMSTELHQATTWSSDGFRIGLNRWTSGATSTGYYADSSSPSSSVFTSDMTYDIDHGHPLGADTVESANGAHYNGHPTDKTIGHWLAAYGYTSSGASTKWSDPSTSVWSSAAPYFTATNSYFVTTFLQNNGITW